MYKALILDDDLKESFQKELYGYEILEAEKFVFSGGESHIKIKDSSDALLHNTEHLLIITKLKTAQDLTDLAIAVNAFINLGADAKIHLMIGYLPGGRQDRVCANGEANSSKVYANLIDSMYDWDSVQYIDAHSDVMPAIFKGYNVNNNNYRFVDEAIVELDLENFTLVSPDAGANKKVLGLAQHILNTDYPLGVSKKEVDVVRADKLRDISNGQILETIVYADDLTGKDCVIVDDICDGGRTFIELAKILRSKGARNVILIVTHGIFSKGYDVVLEHVDQIVTTNSFAELSDDDGDKVTVLGLDLTYYISKEND